MVDGTEQAHAFAKARVFTKKPVTIEAVQFLGDVGAPGIVALDLASRRDGDQDVLLVPTNHGEVVATAGDWIIRQVDGELYPCKDSVFQATYAPAKPHPHHKSYEGGGRGLTFGQAIEQLKAGDRVARDGWNGKGMWLSLSGPLPGREIAFENFWSSNNSEYARLNGGSAIVLPCITMKTATGEILMGWLASQSDMLAEDWAVVSGEPARDARTPGAQDTRSRGEPRP